MFKESLLAVFCIGAVFPTFGQLAITEAMSSAANTQNGQPITANSDFWELTNFGTNDIDLTGYSFNDNSGGFLDADPSPFNGITLRAGESILFYEMGGGTGTETDFRTWWGIAPTVQVRGYAGNGLSATADGVRVWAPGAASDADFVDSVAFGAAVRGRTFTYNPADGTFGLLSTNGVNGAFKAATADDYGSPGTTVGAVPLTITQQPSSQSANAGANATFTSAATGLPRPRFQWRFNGSDIAGATLASYTVTNVQASSTGQYQVVVFNGVQSVNSAVASLTLNSTPEPPTITTALVNQVVYAGQNATFTVAAFGVPEPVYYWRFGGNLVAGPTGPSYTIAGAQAENSGTYSVVASNASGVATSQATLSVTARPNLVITEVCSLPSTNGADHGHNDWWELTNLDSFAVDLFGYVMDDGSVSRASGFRVTNHVVIAPGESVIFVEGMSARNFRKWWGAVNLRTNLQVITYSGSGLSLSSSGDAVVLWNPGAIDDSDFVAAVSFSTATPGVTFGYNPDTGVFGDPSFLGQYGAFRSVENDDIGSPGYIRTPPEPRLYNLNRTPEGYELTWYGLSGRHYAVEQKTDLAPGSWTVLTNVTATAPITTATLPATPTPTGRRFLRLSLLP